MSLTPFASRELHRLTSQDVAEEMESAVDRGNTNPELQTWLNDVSLVRGDVVTEPLDDHSEAATISAQSDTRLVLRLVSSQEMDTLEQLRFGSGADGPRDHSLLSRCLDCCCIA